MKMFRQLLILLQSILLVSSTAIIPQYFTFPTLGAVSVNGSSATGRCSSVTLNRNATTTCHTPTSSVLFDGNIPTLTDLEGDTWASQFTVLQRRSPNGLEQIYADFSTVAGFTGVGRVEIVLFNCPELGVTAQYLQLWPPYTTTYLTLSSCTSLQRVCIPYGASQILNLQFYFANGEQRLYLAEITFYNSSYPCPAFTLLNPPPVDNSPSSEPATMAPPTVPPGLNPTHFFFPTLQVISVNGSSATGHCSNVTLNRDATTTCHTPTSSVLFDGIIPTLTGLEGDTWASQFMVLRQGRIRVDFSGFTRVGRVEIVLFNCPEWGITAWSIYFYSSTYLTLSSCTSLQRVCIPYNTYRRTLDLQFSFANGEQRLYLAEMTFYNSSSPCPAFTLLNSTIADKTPSARVTSSQTSSTPTQIGTAEFTGNEAAVQYGSTALILSIIAIVVTFTLVLVAALVLVLACCKYRYYSGPAAKSQPGPAPQIASEEEQVYEDMDGQKWGRMPSIKIKDNKAYSTRM